MVLGGCRGGLYCDVAGEGLGMVLGGCRGEL